MTVDESILESNNSQMPADTNDNSDRDQATGHKKDLLDKLDEVMEEEMNKDVHRIAVQEWKSEDEVEISDEKRQESSKRKQQIEQIIEKYMQIYNIVFGRWPYVLLFVFSIAFTWIVSQAYADTKLSSKNMSIQQRESSNLKKHLDNMAIRDTIQERDITIGMKQGLLSLENSTLYSLDNFVLYKGLVLPSTSTLRLKWAAQNLPHSSVFQNKEHTVEDVQNYLNTVIYSSYSRQNASKEKVISMLPIPSWIIEYFGLNCIFYPSQFTGLCDEYMKSILPLFSIYRLSSDYSGLEKLGKVLMKKDYSRDYCEAIRGYVLNTKDFWGNMSAIIADCPPKYNSEFKMLKDFITVQDQLRLSQIDDKVSKDSLINAYKLVSVMQQIYIESRANRSINTTRVEWYVFYVRNLLRTKNSLPAYYFDVIASYNNTFLVPYLKSLIWRAEKSTADRYKKILDSISELSQGNTYDNYPALDEKISSKDYMIEEDLDWDIFDPLSGNETTETLVDMFSRNYKFSNRYAISSYDQINDKELYTKWNLHFDNPASVALANGAALEVQFSYDILKQQFFAQRIVMPRQEQLTSILNNMLNIEPVPISELYNLIITTSQSTKNTEEQVDVCTYFAENPNLSSCTDTLIDIRQNGLIYKIVYSESEGVIDYSINNEVREKEIKKEFWAPIIVTRNPISAINLILWFVLDKDIDDSALSGDSAIQGGLAEIQIQKHISEIGGSVVEIMAQWPYYIVEFSVKWTTFIGIYEYSSSSLVGLWVEHDKITHPVRNFRLNFTTTSNSDKRLFSNDPGTYLLKIDPLTVKQVGLK